MHKTVQHIDSLAYRFLVFKSVENILECNTIIESRDAEFSEHVFPMQKESPTVALSNESSYIELNKIKELS